MDRTQKETAVAELTDAIKDAEAIFAVDYRGISVTDAAELRGKLTEADAVFKVVKNRLAKRAIADAGTEGIDELLVGPTALTLIKGDAVIAAKAIFDFAKEHDELEYKGGFMDGAALDRDSFTTIARLPGRDALFGQLVGLTASPLTGLAAGMNNLISGLGRQLAQIAEQGLVTGETPAAEEAPAEEAPAEEAPAEEAPADEAPAEEAPAEDAPAEDAPAEEKTSEEPAAEASGETEDAPDADSVEETPDAEPETEPEPETETDEEASEEAAPEGEAAEDDEEA